MAGGRGGGGGDGGTHGVRVCGLMLGHLGVFSQWIREQSNNWSLCLYKMF